MIEEISVRRQEDSHQALGPRWMTQEEVRCSRAAQPFLPCRARLFRLNALGTKDLLPPPRPVGRHCPMDERQFHDERSCACLAVCVVSLRERTDSGAKPRKELTDRAGLHRRRITWPAVPSSSLSWPAFAPGTCRIDFTAPRSPLA